MCCFRQVVISFLFITTGTAHKKTVWGTLSCFTFFLSLSLFPGLFSLLFHPLFFSLLSLILFPFLPSFFPFLSINSLALSCITTARAFSTFRITTRVRSELPTRKSHVAKKKKEKALICSPNLPHLYKPQQERKLCSVACSHYDGRSHFLSSATARTGAVHLRQYESTGRLRFL